MELSAQPETTDCAGSAISQGRRGRADRRSGKPEDRGRSPRRESRWRIKFPKNRPAATDKRSAKHPEHPQRSSGSATAAGGTLRAMGRASRDTTKDRSPPDIAVSRVDCSDQHVCDPGGLGSPTGIGEDGSRSSPKADVENSFKSGNAAGRPLTNTADHFRCTTADAYDPGSGNGGTDRGFSGFHPGILRLVCF